MEGFNRILFLIPAVALSGCALTPTHESVANYAVYDMKDAQHRSPDQVASIYIDTLKTMMSDVNVSRNIPPSPLPDKPGRFQLTNPLGNSGLGALMAANGASMNVPVCEGAFVVAKSDDTGMSQWGENTHFYNCLWQYKDGWHLDWYVSFDKQSGGASAEAVAKALVNSVAGDSRKNMKAYQDNIIHQLNGKGLATRVTESYPAQ